MHTLINNLPTLSDTVFLIIAIFLVVEILSQLLKFEIIGKIYIQFYVVLMHALITLALLSYESRELTIYFVTLIALINSIRFILYKLPALKNNNSLRFLFDLFIIGGLIVLLYNLSQLLHIELQATNLSLISKYSILANLSIVLLYEMVQRAKTIGLDVRDYLPRTLPAFILVFAAIIGATYFFYGSFTFEETYKELLYIQFFIYNLVIIGLMIILSNFKKHDNESYSILYVLPTFVMFGVFISIFISL